MAGQESQVKRDSSSSANARPFEQAIKRLAQGEPQPAPNPRLLRFLSAPIAP